jgi:hypothetical protein
MLNLILARARALFAAGAAADRNVRCDGPEFWILFAR